MSAAAVRRLQEVAFENVPAMDDEGENEFVSEQVNEIVKNAITKTLGGSELYSSLFLSHVLKSELWTKQFALRPARSQYSKERVTSRTNQIIDECLKDIVESFTPATSLSSERRGFQETTSLALVLAGACKVEQALQVCSLFALPTAAGLSP